MTELIGAVGLYAAAVATAVGVEALKRWPKLKPHATLLHLTVVGLIMLLAWAVASGDRSQLPAWLSWVAEASAAGTVTWQGVRAAAPHVVAQVRGERQ